MTQLYLVKGNALFETRERPDGRGCEIKHCYHVYAGKDCIKTVAAWPSVAVRYARRVGATVTAWATVIECQADPSAIRPRPIADLPPYALIIRAVLERGELQDEALLELKSRGLWLSRDLKLQAGLIPGPWQPGNCGIGPRKWFVFRYPDQFNPGRATEYLRTQSGNVMHFGSFKAAKRRADALNKETDRC